MRRADGNQGLPSALTFSGTRHFRSHIVRNLCHAGPVELEFSGELVEWRGPAPFHFVPLPPDEADLVDEVKADVVYWGVVPVRAWIGDTEFTTSMFPREDTWFLPVKDAVRRAEQVELGEVVEVRLRVGRD